MRSIITVLVLLSIANPVTIDHIGSIVAQEQTDQPQPAQSSLHKTTSLGIRQARVERMMEDVDRKFKEFSQLLAETEPDRAERLVQTLQQAKELLIQHRMQQITGLLNREDLQVASEQQQQVLDDIRRLIQILLDEQNPEVVDEYERLRRWREAIRRLLDEQRGHERESGRIVNKDQSLADLEAQIRAVERLIRKQTSVNEQIDQARQSGGQAFRRAADQQHQVRQETEQVAQSIRKAAGIQEPMADRAGSSESSRSSVPASAPLQQAASHQQSAEENLQSGKPGGAQNEGQVALDKLNEALDELKKQRRRLVSLPPEEFERLADRQEETTERTEQLDKEMNQSASASGQQQGNQPAGANPDGGSSPGQDRIQNAGRAMQRAASGLREQDPQAANRQQDEAVRQLENALAEIEERLAQLREETQEEKLARLEQRFVEMLNRQTEATRQTVELDSRRTGNRLLRRADRLVIGKIANEENELAEMAQQALDILIEDGTSVVFPQIVQAVREDLLHVADLLQEQESGAYTQHLQQEIEATLQELIDALQRLQQQRQNNSGQGGGGGGESPLLPNSAELKLLKAAQLRVNRRTKAFHQHRPEGSLDEIMREEIEEIAVRQLEITVMTERLISRSPLIPLN